MKSKSVLYLGILVLATSLSIVTYNYLQLRKREKESRDLLVKSAHAIDSDNSYLHDDLSMILNSDYLAKGHPDLPLKKEIFDSLVLTTKTKDSISLVKDLIKQIRSKLDLNDSLYDMRSNWTKHGIIDYSYSMIENLEHKPIYKFGDTVDFKFLIIEQLGYKTLSYEIVDFSPKKYGEKSRHSLIFTIPTKSLNLDLEKPTEYEFKFTYILKNIYTNKQDTFYSSKTFTVIP